MGNTAQQGDWPLPAPWVAAALEPPPRGCGTDALSAVLTPAAPLGGEREEMSSFLGRPDSFPNGIISPKGTLRDLALRTDPGRRSEREETNFGPEPERRGMRRPPQPLRPQGIIKLSKVWQQLGDKGGILETRRPRRGGSKHRSRDTCFDAPH